MGQIKKTNKFKSSVLHIIPPTAKHRDELPQKMAKLLAKRV